MANDTSLGGLFAGNKKPAQFGRIFKPDPAWLAKAAPEPILDPDLAIVDTHHHLWDMPGYRYLLDDFLADASTGHKVVATVFEECRAMYRAHGPVEMQPVGEVEFAAGVAAMSDSGNYGPTRVSAGIVGHADLTLGDRVAPVLEAEIAAGGGRFKGIRFGAAWDDDPVIGNSHVAKGPGVHRQRRVPCRTEAPVRRSACRSMPGSSITQLAEVAELARAFPEGNIVLCHMGGVLGYGRWAGKKDEVFTAWKAAMAELAKCPNVSVKVGGLMMRLAAIDYLQPPGAADVAAAGRRLAALCRHLPGAVRRRPLHGREQLPGGQDGHRLRGLFNALKRIAAGASATEKTALFSGTAKRVYRLEW